MDKLIIKAKEDTPEIILDQENAVFSIIGRSLPEDIIQFYTPVYEWLESYVDDPLEETVFVAKIDYFNSASQRAINEIFTIASKIKLKGKSVKVQWHYNDDDLEMKETGEEYEDITELEFEYVPYIINNG